MKNFTKTTLLFILILFLHGCATLASIGKVDAEKLNGMKRIGIAAVTGVAYMGDVKLLNEVVQTAQSKLPGLTIIPIEMPAEYKHIIWGEGISSYWDADKKAALQQRLKDAAIQSNLDAVILFRPARAPGSNSYKLPFTHGFEGVAMDIKDSAETGEITYIATSFYAIVFDGKSMEVIGKKSNESPITKMQITQTENTDERRLVSSIGLKILLTDSIRFITTDLLGRLGFFPRPQ